MRWWWTCPGSGCSHGAAALGLVLLLSACAPADPAGAMLEEYRSRMSRVLELEVAPEDREPLAGWPRRRDRVLEIPRHRTGLTRFLSLHRCDLGSLIGERSSQLGRVMSASGRLSYEHRFLVKAQQCLDRLAGDPDAAALRADLVDVVRAKRAYLPAIAWNATLGSDALAGGYALDVAPLAPDAAAAAGRAEIAAVRELARRVERLGTAGLDTASWDEPWAVLDRSDFPGRHRRSVAQLTRVLDDVAWLLEARGAQRPPCPQGRPTATADILQNVFRGYYAEAVQPYLVAVDSAGRGWLEAIERLRRVQDAEPPEAFERFAATVLAQDAGEWQRFVAARDRHTAAWQAVLEHCGLAPRPPNAVELSGVQTCVSC